MAEPSPARVAVLLSTFNGEAVLEAQLDSLVAQRGVTVELFVRDDGSTDSTRAILARYARYWPRLATPTGGDHQGITASYLGMLAAAPDGFDGYAFCDQDDVWLPDKLAWATEALARADPATPTLFSSAVICVDNSLNRLGEIIPSGDTRFEHVLFENVSFGAASVMNGAARRLICERLPDASQLFPDWWMALTVSAFGDIIQDRRPTILYRQHGANATGGNPNPLAEFAARLRRFRANPRQFYRLHAQAAEFLRLHRDELSPAQRALVEKLVASRTSLPKRLSYALAGKVVRADILRGIAARVLIAADLY